MKNPIAFSTNAFTRFSLAEALRAIRGAGFGWVEILADGPHADPAIMGGTTGGVMGAAALARETRGELSRLGLSVSNVNCNCSFSYWSDAPPEPFFEPSLISPVEKYRVDRAERIRRAIDFAAGVGSGSVSITTGRCLAHVSPEVARGLLAENLWPVLEYADKAGVNVGIECEPGLYVEYAAELAALIAELGHPRLGANLDTGHSVVLGEPLGEAFAALRGRIWNTHVEDLPGRKHWHAIPGRGSFPWGELRAAVEGTGYAGPLTVELYTHTAEPEAAARESFEFLSGLVGG